MKKPRMGRPKLPAAEVRGCRMMINWTAAELAAIEKLAQASDEQPSVWARRVILRALGKGKKA